MTKEERELRREQREHMKRMEAAAKEAGRGPIDVPFLLLVLLLVGIVYICETLSDIIQVAYFKATHGKRIFKMAPLHHHFELCGWSEVKLVTIFTLVSAVFCMLALWGVIGRYHF